MNESDMLRKKRRYLALTVVASPTNFAIYAALLRVTTWPAISANLLAASLVTPPTFFASRYWIWSMGDSGNITRQGVLYWVTTAVNVLLSSGAVWGVDAVTDDRLVLAITPLCVYGVLWAARFLLLDRFVFDGRRSDDVSQRTDANSVPDTEGGDMSYPYPGYPA